MIILGAKGLAKELLHVLNINDNIKDIKLFDNINDEIPSLLYGQFKVLKTWDELEHELRRSPDFLIGVGDNKSRFFLAEKGRKLGGNLSSLISKTAEVGQYGNVICNGVCILSQAIVTTDVYIGEGTLINKAVILSHDVVVGKYCEVSPGARLLGRTKIGDFTEIGTNSIILPDVKIGDNCKIGAGAVVTKDVPDNTTVVGIPAKPIN